MPDYLSLYWPDEQRRIEQTEEERIAQEIDDRPEKPEEKPQSNPKLPDLRAPKARARALRARPTTKPTYNEF